MNPTPYDPYLPPAADLEAPAEVFEGPLLPWEDRENHPDRLSRAMATVRILTTRPQEAGSGLAARRKVGPALSFLLLVGLPLPWAVQLLMAFLGPFGSGNPFEGLFGLPKAPPPTPEMLGIQRIVGFVTAAVMPLGALLGTALNGLVAHTGLWMTRGLGAGRGLETTLRCTSYAMGCIFLVSWIFSLGPLLPPPAFLGLLAFSILFWIGASIWQGSLLARAHGTDTWRGILGIFLPWLLIVGCCGGVILVPIALVAMGGRF